MQLIDDLGFGINMLEEFWVDYEIYSERKTKMQNESKRQREVRKSTEALQNSFWGDLIVQDLLEVREVPKPPVPPTPPPTRRQGGGFCFE